MNAFRNLGLSDNLVEVLDDIGFKTPTPIQEQAIPLLLQQEATDFIGLAQTGTGKTAAFGLPLVELVDVQNKATQALIMAPTRELGQQTATQLQKFSTHVKGLNVVVVYGGANISTQIKQLKKPTQIIVATPGRLLDLINRRVVQLEQVEYVVLDEADEMLNMGFKEDIDKILEHTPEQKVTWLFSATMPAGIRKITKKYMHDPAELSVNSKELVNKDIEHKYVVTKSREKITAIRRFLDIQPDMRGVMFCRTRRETQEIADDLSNLGYGVEALHGELSQSQRDAVMKRFKRRSMQLLIATDVAARGIDVTDLTHVLHHRLPDQLDVYTHRSGRTGRAGKKGVSIAFIIASDVRKIKDLERKNKIKIEKIDPPSLEELRSSRMNNWASLIVNTKVDQQAEEILELMHERFEGLSKEDILKRLITTQLDHLMVEGGEELSKPDRKRDPKKKAKDDTPRSEKASTPEGHHRYFVNVGMIDGVTKGDLVHFIADIGEIDRSAIGQVNLMRNHSYFNVDAEKVRGLSSKFEGIEIDGRPIRVNRDHGGRSDVKKVKRKGKSKNTKRNFPKKKRRR